MDIELVTPLFIVYSPSCRCPDVPLLIFGKLGYWRCRPPLSVQLEYTPFAMVFANHCVCVTFFDSEKHQELAVTGLFTAV